jgi:serine/threonine protein kinase
MVAYDYEVLQSKELFTEEIFKMVETLPTLLTFDATMNDFILQLLILSPKERPNIRTICMHPWLEGSFDALLVPKPKSTKHKAKRRPSISDHVSHSDSALISMPVRIKVCLILLAFIMLCYVIYY